MIARVWVGITREAQAGGYLAYLKRTRVKDYRASAGNQGVFVLQRVCGGRAEFVLLSLWEAFDAIQDFPRGESDKEVPYPEEKEFLLEPGELNVFHYKVLIGP